MLRRTRDLKVDVACEYLQVMNLIPNLGVPFGGLDNVLKQRKRSGRLSAMGQRLIPESSPGVLFRPRHCAYFGSH